MPIEPQATIDEVLDFLAAAAAQARQLAAHSQGDSRTPQRVLLTQVAVQAEHAAAGLKQSVRG